MGRWRAEPDDGTDTVLPHYPRGGADLVRMVRSAQRDRPEEVITAVGCPTLLVRGVYDTFAPADWVDRLTETAPTAGR